MMKNIARLSMLAAGLALALTAGVVTAEKPGTEASEAPYTLVTLTENIEDLDKKEVALSGTIIGVCKSGCKMWVADGKFKKGDPFILVRAKDDAFKFKTDATGKSVKLHGYAVAEFLDFCAKKGEINSKAKGAKSECAGPGDTDKVITFFAARVKYGR